MATGRNAATRNLPDVVAHADWTALEPLWRRLEADGRCTPYQRFDFVAPWYRSVAAARGARPLVLEVRSGGPPALLLPLETVEVGLARIARFPGGRQANFGGPLVDPNVAAAVTPSDLADALRAAGRSLRIDGYALGPMLPDAWNPLAALGRDASSVSACLVLDGPAGAVLERTLSVGTRKHFAKKRRKLAELGPVSFRPAGDAAEAATLLDVFLQQKADRFSALGIADPFADPALRAFLREATGTQRNASPAASTPALEIFALWCGERPVGIFGAAATHERMSGSFICFDPTPDIARCSPGELMLVEAIRLAVARGHRVFDLGVGRGALKARFCKDPQPLVEVLLPATALGSAALAMIGAAGRLKELLQRDERLARPARRVAGWLGIAPKD